MTRTADADDAGNRVGGTLDNNRGYKEMISLLNFAGFLLIREFSPIGMTILKLPRLPDAMVYR